MKQKIIVFILIASLSILNACLDPKAIADYSTSAVNTFTTLENIGEEFEASCIRLSAYLGTNCVEFEKGQKALLKIQDVMTSYLTSLNKLADNDFTTYTQNLDGFEEQVLAIKSFNDDDKTKIKAVKGLSSLLVEAATSSYRRKELTNVISNSNTPFQTIMEGLRAFVDGQVREQLQQELDKVTAVIRQLKVAYADNDLLAKEALKTLVLLERKLKYKISALDSYLVAIDNIKSGHQKLYNSRNKLDDEVLIKLITDKSKELKEAINEVKVAF
jgi:predicted RNA-binding protein with RPS1 domain